MKFIECNDKSIFNQESDLIVNPVNCVGVMGKGLALDFKNRYPENYKAYALACDRNEVKLGNMHIFKNSIFYNPPHPKWIINFPTKNDWRSDSDIRNIEIGMIALANEIKRMYIKSVSIPALGCGLGKLNYNDVKRITKDTFRSYPSDVTIYLFEPQE